MSSKHIVEENPTEAQSKESSAYFSIRGRLGIAFYKWHLS